MVEQMGVLVMLTFRVDSFVTNIVVNDYETEIVPTITMRSTIHINPCILLFYGHKL